MKKNYKKPHIEITSFSNSEEVMLTISSTKTDNVLGTIKLNSDFATDF